MNVLPNTKSDESNRDVAVPDPADVRRARFGGIAACVALLVVHGGIQWLRAGYAVGEDVPPDRALATMPNELGSWRGTEDEIDPRIFRSLGATEAVNRTYSASGRPAIALHCGYWQNDDDWTPHRPQGCYAATGWTLVGEEGVSASSAGARFRLCTFEREGRRVLALYWYQLGDRTFHNRDTARAARRHLWGRDSRPATFKALLQAPDDSRRSREALTELANLVFVWSSELWTP